MENVERIVTAAAVSPNEENVDRALRPTLLSEYVGQELVRDQLSIFIAAAKRRGGRKPKKICAFLLRQQSGEQNRWIMCCCMALRASEKRRLPTSWQTKWE